MRADKYGTWAEQVRHSQGWRPGNKHPRCEFCAYLLVLNREPSILARCSKGAFATSIAACCDQFQPAQVVEVTP